VHWFRCSLATNGEFLRRVLFSRRRRSRL
jgi:hypothetical protein